MHKKSCDTNERQKREKDLVERGLRDVVLGDPDQLGGVEGVEDEAERQPATHLRHQGEVMLLLRAWAKRQYFSPPIIAVGGTFKMKPVAFEVTWPVFINFAININ